MKSFIKGAALLLAVVCLVWIAVLWRWRVAHRDMDAGDIVLYLAVLPAVVFVLALAARWAVVGALARQDAGAVAARGGTAQHADGAEAAESGATVAGAAGPRPSWYLLDAWVHTAAGADADGLLAAAASGSPRPGPDAALHDDEGLPVMTARIAHLAVRALEADLQESQDSTDAGYPEPPPERALRALSSLAVPVGEFAFSLAAWAGQWDGAGAPGGDHPRRPGAGSMRMVRVLAAWPADWSDATCAVAQAWLSRRLRDPLADLLPAARWSIQGQRMSGTELLAAGERALEALRQQERDDPVVLVACHSDLDDAGLRTLAGRQALFHAERRPRVPMAGEGAAVLALSALAGPATAGPGHERVRMSPPALVRRAASIDAVGRTATADTVQLVERSLAAAGVQGASVAALASDADQHTARATELFAVTLALVPGLDAQEDLRLAGAVTGRLEAAAPLVTLAMAAAQVRATGGPAVALSLADPHWRMAAVLQPDRSDAVPPSAG